MKLAEHARDWEGHDQSNTARTVLNTRGLYARF
jgi:hypothetical protein